MSVLQTLKLTQKPVISFTAEAQRRQKLIVKLQEQLRLAESALGGNKYMRMRWTTIADADGEPQRVQRAVRYASVVQQGRCRLSADDSEIWQTASGVQQGYECHTSGRHVSTPKCHHSAHHSHRGG